MTELKKYGKVLETDVLVVGGGMGGLSAAITAREQDVDVLVVESMQAGFAGMGSRAGNGILSMRPGDDIEEYIEFLSRHMGKYLNDQDALRRHANMIDKSLHKLIEWGVNIAQDEDGKIIHWKHIYAPWSNTGVGLTTTKIMKEHALKIGVRIKNHVDVTGLLKSEDGSVIGAVGFDIKNGDFYIFRAKAVILACSGCGFRSTRMFNGKGEGIKLAWEAGAKMRNAEYGNMYEVSDVASGESVYGTCAIYITPMYVYNQNGERIWEKYVHWPAPDTCGEIILGMEQEEREGRGPLYIDMEKLGEATEIANARFAEENAEVLRYPKFFAEKHSWYMERVMGREGEYFEHQEGNPIVKPGLHGNFGPISVDINQKTSLDGLYAVGVDSASGNAAYGAIPNPYGQRGNGLGMSAVTGMIGGEEAAKYIKTVSDLKDIDITQVEHFRQELDALKNPEGTVSAYELITRIQDAYTPLKYSMRRSEESLKESLALIQEIKKEFPKMKAADWHEMMVANQTKAMALCVEIAQNSALERKESRGFHFREDYPETDNENWLKWVIVQNVDGKMQVSTEDIPMDTYRYQPENSEAY